MKYPRISIVTPSLNQGKYLESTICSILDQGYPDLEYIIIDGGSCDNSLEIIKKYEGHLSYWISENDRGQSDAINKGLISVAENEGELAGVIAHEIGHANGQKRPTRVENELHDHFAQHPENGKNILGGPYGQKVPNVLLEDDPGHPAQHQHFNDVLHQLHHGALGKNILEALDRVEFVELRLDGLTGKNGAYLKKVSGNAQ